jgi:hypothetical protein
MLTAVMGLGAIILVLGAIASSAYGAVALALGLVVIVGLAAAISLLGQSFESVNRNKDGMSALIDGFVKMGENVDSMLKASIAITALGGAMMAFSAGTLMQGMSSTVGKVFEFLSGDPIEKLERLAAIGERLKMTADAINSLSTSFITFKIPDIGDVSQLEDLADLSAKMNVENSPTVNVAPPENKEIVAKLDELGKIIKGMKIYMDAKVVGKIIAENTDAPGRG